MTDTSQKIEQQTKPLSLTQQFDVIMTKLAEMDQVSSMRVDLKAKMGQQLVVDAVKLSGTLTQSVEHQQNQIKALYAKLISLENRVIELEGAANEKA
ncbi:hypothetical protein [Shewanella psychrotolerans]|uniref:hypothetical protein n=1 Tax=Shewanella psychrotolerans TaxID=2864206 RepID=UPI001C65EC5A|nr:hypothetical protein [Shewanella psychrotolerans]QYK03136.1 hypothetical protein K0I62_09550 [Shewanella psychrotolerans]